MDTDDEILEALSAMGSPGKLGATVLATGVACLTIANSLPKATRNRVRLGLLETAEKLQKAQPTVAEPIRQIAESIRP